MSDDQEEQPRIGRRMKRALGRREARSADELTDQLLEAKPQVLDQVDIDDVLREAIEKLRGMFGKKERPRHLRYVHSLVRDRDMDAIAASLTRATETGGYDPKNRLAELWRDRLSEQGDDALNLLCDEYPAADRTTLRQAIRQVQKAKNDAEASHARRHVFELVRELLEEPAPDGSGTP